MRSPRSSRDEHGFGWITAADRRRADRFFASLLGRPDAQSSEDDASETVDCPPPAPVPTACTGVGTRDVLDCFDLDRAVVLPRHEAQIVNLVRCILASHSTSTPVRTLELVGHADPSGPADHNRRLGQQRADAVRAAIEAAWRRISGRPMSGLTITTSSRGATSPVSGRAARSRRVEVLLPAAIPATPPCACAVGADGDALRVRIAATIEQTAATTTPHDGGSVTGQRGPSGLFGTNFDYHSAIHAHWALLNLYRSSADTAALTRALTRASEASIAAEWAFLQRPANLAFELPYGRAWFVLLLSELAREPARNLPAAVARRDAAELELIDWLEANRAQASDDATLGVHDSWLFALLLLVMSAPASSTIRARIDAIFASVVATNRATWRTRASRPNDFLHVPSIIDTLDLLRGQPAAVTASTVAPSRIATLTGGHEIGEELTRLWPIALLARTDPAMCRLLGTRLTEWLAHPEHWEFGPTTPHAAWSARFSDNSHWTPQFLWMAMRLRC